MFSQKLFLRIALCGILWPTQPVDARGESNAITTLPQVLQKALLSSPTYLTTKNELEVAKLEAANAKALFFPSLDLSASHGVRDINPDTAGLTARSQLVSGTTLTLSENFYDNGETSKRNRIAGYKFQLAQINFQKNRSEIIRSVTLAFYRYNISLQNLKFTTKNFEELQRLAKLVSNQYFQGMKTKKDYLSFKTRSQRSRLDVIAAEQNLLESRTDLLAKMGLDADDPIRFDEAMPPKKLKRIASEQLNSENLYESQRLAIQKKISELEVDLAKRLYWPELSLVGTASYGSSNYIDTGQNWSDNDISQWSVLVNLKFNLLDWGIRSRNIQIALASQNSQEQGFQILLLQAQKELESFKLEVARSEENYRLSKELQKMEEDTFKILERDYRSGQTTYLELTTGLANLLDAQSRGLEADYVRTDLNLRWKYYKGTLSEESIFE